MQKVKQFYLAGCRKHVPRVCLFWFVAEKVTTALKERTIMERKFSLRNRGQAFLGDTRQQQQNWAGGCKLYYHF